GAGAAALPAPEDPGACAQSTACAAVTGSRRALRDPRDVSVQPQHGATRARVAEHVAYRRAREHPPVRRARSGDAAIPARSERRRAETDPERAAVDEGAGGPVRGRQAAGGGYAGRGAEASLNACEALSRHRRETREPRRETEDRVVYPTA